MGRDPVFSDAAFKAHLRLDQLLDRGPSSIVNVVTIIVGRSGAMSPKSC
jgi:hypothetical protein